MQCPHLWSSSTWLCLANMRDADKVQFLNAPVSQTGLFGDTVKSFAQQFSAQQKQTEVIRYILPRRAAAASTHLQQPPAKQCCGAGRRQASQHVQAPVKPGDKHKSKRP